MFDLTTPASDLMISRRHALTALGAAGALGAMAPLARAQREGAMAPDELGWDKAKGEYTLPPLPYDYDALEPHIDEQTMRIHHDKHHAGYVRGVNRAMSELAKIREGEGDAGLIKHWSRELAFHGSGHVNHTLFWMTMAPAAHGGGGSPSGALRRMIERDFGSFTRFRMQFTAAAGAVEGSGWGWLAYEPVADRLIVLQGEKQQNLTMTGATPILGVDVWEHAYYLKHQNRRKDYIEAFFNIINWTKVAELLTRARGG